MIHCSFYHCHEGKGQNAQKYLMIIFIIFQGDLLLNIVGIFNEIKIFI